MFAVDLDSTLNCFTNQGARCRALWAAAVASAVKDMAEPFNDEKEIPTLNAASGVRFVFSGDQHSDERISMAGVEPEYLRRKVLKLVCDSRGGMRLARRNIKHHLDKGYPVAPDIQQRLARVANGW